MTRFVFWSVPLNGSRCCMRLGKLTEFHEEKNYRTLSWKIWQRPRLPVNPSSQPNDMYPSCWWDVGQPIHFAGSYPPFLLVNDGLGLRPINQDTPIWMKITTTGWTWVASELVIEVRWLNQESSWMIPKFAISVWKSTINHLFGIPCCETPLIAGYHLRSPPTHPPSKAKIIIILVVFIVTH